MADNVNTELRDLLLKRQHYIARFENGTISDVVSHYNTAKTGIVGRIRYLEDFGEGFTRQYRIDRLNNQLNEINAILERATSDAIGTLSYDLERFAGIEKAYYENLLATKFGEIGVNITRLPFEQVDEILRTPLGGALYNERMLKTYQDSMYTMKNALTQSVIQGEDMAKASRRLVGVGKNMGGAIGERIVRQSDVIARTEIMRVSNSVQKGIYDKNQDILKGVQYVATLDDRTCEVCGAIDGKVFYYNKNPVSASEQPPRHPRCRCVLAPITKSWKELGAEKVEIGPGERPYVYRGAFPLQGALPYSSRAKWAGQVPDTMPYPKWLGMMDVQDPEFVKDILGSKRYGFWKSGKLNFKQMVRDGKLLNIDELDELVGGQYAFGPPMRKVVKGATPQELYDASKANLDDYVVYMRTLKTTKIDPLEITNEQIQQIISTTKGGPKLTTHRFLLKLREEERVALKALGGIAPTPKPVII